MANWFRLEPFDATPRARICARYASILRHICTWKDPVDGEGYDAVVIVAHSQGTVITADLLRFLKRQWANCPDPELSRIFAPGVRERELPVFFLTMGSPLRQIYGERFPVPYPARTSFGVAFLWKGAKVQIDCVARRP